MLGGKNKFTQVQRVLNSIDNNVLVFLMLRHHDHNFEVPPHGWPKHEVLMNINVSKIKHMLIYVF